MNIPTGYTEEEVLSIIEKIASMLSSSFIFGYYDEEDIKQECYIFGMDAVSRFNPNVNCSLSSFLFTHIRNRLSSLRRDKYFRNTSPCMKCVERDAPTNTCTSYPNIHDCPKYLSWYSRNTAKQNIMAPTHTTMELPCSFDEESNIESMEMFSYISNRVPAEMRADFLRFAEGAKLSKERASAVLSMVRGIVGLDGDEEEEGEEEDNE